MKVTTWIIATHNSDETEIYLHKKFGNANDVKDAIWDMMVHDRENDEENFDEDSSYDRCEIENVEGRIYSYIQFYGYHIDYTAWQLDDIQEIPEG
jgi:hypothetical protein